MYIFLHDILDVDQLIEDYNNNYIRESTNEQDPTLHILCYTADTQYRRHWNNATRAARGLCVKYPGSLKEGTATRDYLLHHAEVKSRGIPKFFTVETATEAAEGSDNIILSLEDDDELVTQLQGLTVPGDARVHVADKLDGAMGVGYIDRDDKFKIHTKGSFTSDEAIIANRILTRHPKIDADAKHLIEYFDLSPVFEIITPAAEHVIDYGDEEELYLLGGVQIDTGLWWPVELHPELKQFAIKHNFPRPEVFNAKTLEQALKLPPRKNKEGVVVTVQVQMYDLYDTQTDVQRMLKIKYDAFLACQKLKNQITTNALNQLVEELLTKRILTTEVTSKLKQRDLYQICGIDSKIAKSIDNDQINRIAQMRILNAQTTANEHSEQIEDNLRDIAYLFTEVADLIHENPNLTTEEAFVQTTLKHDKEQRPLFFSTKENYLNLRRCVIHNFIKNS